MTARQGLAAAGREVEMARWRTGLRGHKLGEARVASEYLERERVVGGSRGGRRRAGDGNRRRHGEVHGAGDLEKKRARVSDGVE